MSLLLFKRNTFTLFSEKKNNFFAGKMVFSPVAMLLGHLVDGRWRTSPVKTLIKRIDRSLRLSVRISFEIVHTYRSCLESVWGSLMANIVFVNLVFATDVHKGDLRGTLPFTILFNCFTIMTEGKASCNILFLVFVKARNVVYEH